MAIVAEVTWLKWLEDFGVMISTPTSLSSDSTGAIIIAHYPIKIELTKHNGVDTSYMCSQVHNELCLRNSSWWISSRRLR